MTLKLSRLVEFLFPIILLEFLLQGNRQSSDVTFNLHSLAKYVVIGFYITLSIVLSLDLKSSFKLVKFNFLGSITALIVISLLASTFVTLQSIISLVGAVKIILIIIAVYIYTINSNTHQLHSLWQSSLTHITFLLCCTFFLSFASAYSNGFSRSSLFVFNLTHFLPYVVALFLHTVFVYKGKAKLIYLLVLLTYIIISSSRGGTGALLVSLLLTLVFFKKENYFKKFAKMSYLFAFGLFMFWLLVNFRSNEIESLTDEPYRYVLFNVAWEAFLTNPYFGNGYLTFTRESQALASGLGFELLKAKSIHNTHLEILYSFGLITYILIVFLFVRSLLQAKRFVNIDQGMGLFYSSTLMYLLFHSLTINMESAPLFWLVGLTAFILKEKRYD